MLESESDQMDVPIDDDFIVLRAKRDPDAFAPLYEKYALDIYRFCFSRTRNPDTANELTAQVFVRAIERLHQYRPIPGGTFRSWLYMIARNVSHDHARRAGRFTILDGSERDIRSSEPGPEEIAVHRTELDRILNVLDQLSDRARDIVLLRIRGLTTPEIAASMQMTESAVKSVQTRAYRRIRELVLPRQGNGS